MAEIMVFKLIQAASKRWIRLNGSNHIATIIRGVKFKNGGASREGKHVQ